MRIAFFAFAGGFIVAACSGNPSGGDPGGSGGGSGGEQSSGDAATASSGGSSGSGSSSGNGSGSSSGSTSSSGSSSGGGSSSGSTADDAGFACASTSDCGGGGQVCCGTIPLTGGSPPNCTSGGVTVSCTSGSSCPTTLGSSCSGQQIVRLCRQNSDCTESSYGQCCTFPGQNGASLSFCANSLIATFANATCM